MAIPTTTTYVILAFILVAGSFLQASKQFSAIIPVICRVCQANKRFSAVNPAMCKVRLAGKRFSAQLLRYLYSLSEM
jgi:hypothetical protein